MGLQRTDEDVRISEMAAVEQEMKRRTVSFSFGLAAKGATAAELSRSCPLFPDTCVLERPSNPMTKDGRFDDATLCKRNGDYCFVDKEYNDTSIDC